MCIGDSLRKCLGVYTTFNFYGLSWKKTLVVGVWNYVVMTIRKLVNAILPAVGTSNLIMHAGTGFP